MSLPSLRIASDKSWPEGRLCFTCYFDAIHTRGTCPECLQGWTAHVRWCSERVISVRRSTAVARAATDGLSGALQPRRVRDRNACQPRRVCRVDAMTGVLDRNSLGARHAQAGQRQLVHVRRWLVVGHLIAADYEGRTCRAHRPAEDAAPPRQHARTTQRRCASHSRLPPRSTRPFPRQAIAPR